MCGEHDVNLVPAMLLGRLATQSRLIIRRLGLVNRTAFIMMIKFVQSGPYLMRHRRHDHCGSDKFKLGRVAAGFCFYFIDSQP